MPFVIRILIMVITRIRSMSAFEWLGVSMAAQKVYSGDLKREINKEICAEALRLSGFRLNEDEPLSDASLAAAVTERTGITIRSVKDRAMIAEDLDSWAAAMASEKSGYVIRSFMNVEVLKEDMQRVALAILTERVGIPVGVFPSDGELLNPEAIKERLLTWAKAELLAGIGEQVGISVDEIYQMGDIEAIAAELSGRLSEMNSDFELPGRKMAVLIANQMAHRAITDYQRVAVDGSKKSRRKEQLRRAQQKFKQRHGVRSVYVPLGMTATVE